MQAEINTGDLPVVPAGHIGPKSPRALARGIVRAQRTTKLLGSSCLLTAGAWLGTSLLVEARPPGPAHASDLTNSQDVGQPPDGLSPQTILPLSIRNAKAANASIPLTSRPLESGRPLYALSSEPASLRALQCLTSAIYYEAATEPADGKRAVAQVVLNRVRHPAFPASVCGVIYQGAERTTGCQFSFTCDGSLRRKPLYRTWLSARAIAMEALSGKVYSPVGLATHYHADYVLPKWAPKLTKNLVLGRHIFYQWRGSWGQRQAFRQSYAGDEPQIQLRHPPERTPLPIWTGTASPAPARAVIDLNGVRLETGFGTLAPQSASAVERSLASTDDTRYVIALETPAVRLAAVTP